MPLLLCSDCLQWREPFNGGCPVCGVVLEIFVPDPAEDFLAESLGDLQNELGHVSLSRRILPTRGRLFTTTHGLLFVPDESSVFVLSRDEKSRNQQQAWITRVASRIARIAKSIAGHRPRSLRADDALRAKDRHAVARLLLSDPGVWFLSRAAIACWRRQRKRWEFIRPDGHWWPEKILSRNRETDRQLQTWLEETACPQQITP